MKTKIVPNIFALDKEMFDKKLKILEFAKHIHLDFMDGEFTGKSSVDLGDMIGVKEYSDKVFDLHMMAYEPLQCLPRMEDLEVRRVYVQFEVYASDRKLEYDIGIFHEKDMEVGIVLNPATPVVAIKDFVKKIDAVMVMSVWPGEEGQKFMPETLSKIDELRKLGFKGEIAFDGGINLSNVDMLRDHGADIVYVGSAVSSTPDAEKSYKDMCEKVK